MPRPDNTVVMEDVRIIFRNFAGREGMYNREGDRNFAVILDDDVAQMLAEDGWNVKLLKPREDGEPPQPYLGVTVSYKGRPPIVKMIGLTTKKTTELDEDTVEMLDWVDIAQVDLVVRPYDWQVSGNSGRKAYLKSLYVTIIEDDLELKYKNLDIAGVEGPMLEKTEPLIPGR